ncbi:MAG: 2-amino-4-hydroxy-6-hydroxymethyldihydropteridine diphosphokinase [Chloroflexi bacterium]|nr:2-amino-4-hydroxy-6-hydroxymethyldihydropteridine diphosphokinase [Chloroflexota bacterium]
MTRVVVALGSNLGDRAANLQAAIELITAAGVLVDGVSSVWETEPIPADQPAYLNAVVTGKWDGDAHRLLAALKQVEQALGRRPERRWGPRPIDLDILFFGDEQLDTPELTVPHPRIAERAFVLVPLSEVVPGPLPVLGARAVELLDRIGLQGAKRTGVALRRPLTPGPAPAERERGAKRIARGGEVSGR